MNTLDEVIEALEATCKDDPLPWTYDVDALHYLKKYKRLQSKMEKIALGNIEEVLDKLYNPALTWDELKQMVGKPVWFVYDWNKVHYKGWILLDHMEGIFIVDAKDNWALCEVNMDKWQAYRKERK